MTSHLRESLLAIYAKADRAVQQAGPICQASGRCCRFAEFGHTLFLSQIEADYLLEKAPPFTQVDSGTCPFQVEGLCTAREPRPLGCRVYFCDPNYQAEAQRISEEGIRELKALADAHRLPWRYAPLHTFLRQHLEQAEVPATLPRFEQAEVPATLPRFEQAEVPATLPRSDSTKIPLPLTD